MIVVEFKCTRSEQVSDDVWFVQLQGESGSVRAVLNIHGRGTAVCRIGDCVTVELPSQFKEKEKIERVVRKESTEKVPG